MSFTYNGTEVQGVTYNGTEVQQVTYNGTVVWEYAAPFDHNSYGDRNITTYFTSGDLTKDLAKGNFRNVKVGDYINLPSDAEIMGTTGVAKLFVLHADYFQGKRSYNPSDMRHHLVVALGKGTPTSINALGNGSSVGKSSWGFDGGYNTGYYVSSGAVDVRADIEAQVRAIEMLQNHILRHKIFAPGGEASPSAQTPSYYVAEMNICEIDGYEANRVITDPTGFGAKTILEMFGDETEQFDYFRLGRFTYTKFKTRDHAGSAYYSPVVAGTGASNTTYTKTDTLFPLIPYFLLY